MVARRLKRAVNRRIKEENKPSSFEVQRWNTTNNYKRIESHRPRKLVKQMRQIQSLTTNPRFIYFLSLANKRKAIKRIPRIVTSNGSSHLTFQLFTDPITPRTTNKWTLYEVRNESKLKHRPCSSCLVNRRTRNREHGNKLSAKH